MVEINPTVYKELSEIVLEYGIIAFAVLFCIYIVPRSRNWYRKLNIRMDPPPTDSERKTYKSVFLGTSLFSLLLIIAASIWWINLQSSLKIFQGEIQDVSDYIEVTSPDVYLLEHKSGTQPYKDISFVRLYNPKEPPQRLRLYFRKDASSDFKCVHLKFDREILSAVYNYKETDTSGFLQIIAQNHSSKSFSLFKTAMASSEYRHKKLYIMEEEKKYNYSLEEPVVKYLIERLQNERTPIGEKINILSKLQKTDNKETLNEYARYVTDKEPFIFTLLDLSNHSDIEISTKSKEILKAIDKVEIISQLINTASNPQNKAKFYLYRVNEELAREIINTQEENVSWARSFKDKIDSLDYESLMLFPVGSLKGDRYYIKATWDSNNQNVLDSLTVLFNKELATSRTINQEKQIMANRKYRIIYWYSKDWAFETYNKIVASGGKASFMKY